MLFFQDPTPAAEDVTAGGLGAIIFIFLILALVVIGYFMSRQLKKAQAHKDANTYGDPAVDRRTDAGGADTNPATRE
ncbi:MAG: hypothetical protein U0R21_06930 [Nocardioidaceae bacterium]